MNQNQTHPKYLIFALCLSTTLTIIGCKEKGPAEQAGAKIDQASEQAAQNLGNLSDKAKQNIEGAKTAVDIKAQEAQVAIANSLATNAAVQSMEQSSAQAEKHIEATTANLSTQAENAENYLDDAAITLKIKAAILNDPLLSNSHIEVNTSKGEVSLTGQVDAAPAIPRVEDLVRSQQHVTSVKSNLMIALPAAGKP